MFLLLLLSDGMSLNFFEKNLHMQINEFIVFLKLIFLSINVLSLCFFYVVDIV